MGFMTGKDVLIYTLIIIPSVQCTVILRNETNLTWKESYEHCKNLNGFLSSNIADLPVEDKNILTQSTAWIGKVKLLSNWVEIIGCFKFDTSIIPRKIPDLNSMGECGMRCKESAYFAYRTSTKTCICVNQLPSKSENASLCKNDGSAYYTLYQKYKYTDEYLEENYNCMASSCTPGGPSRTNIINGPFIVDCLKDGLAHAVCEDNSTMGRWRNWNESLEFCITNHQSYFRIDLSNPCITALAWTNIFRENRTFVFTMHSKKDVINKVPENCAAMKLTQVNQTLNTVILHDDCNSTRNFFLCQIDYTESESHTTNLQDTSVRSTYSAISLETSLDLDYTESESHTTNLQDTTVRSTYSAISLETSLDLGILIGGICGGVVLLLIVILIVVYKIRNMSKGNRKSKTANHFTINGYDNAALSSQDVQISPSFEDCSDKKENNNRVVYAQVNKKKVETTRSETCETQSDIYMITSENEYDHLNNTEKRKIQTSENIYDSNIGFRGETDPTYDISSHSNRSEDQNIYNHSYSDND